MDLLQLLKMYSIGAFFTIFQFLATWSLMYPFLPSAYLYHYTITTLMFLWAMYDETSAQSCFLLAVLQALGFILDIFALSFHFQDSKNNSQLNNRFEYILCMMAFFTNFFLRTVYVLLGVYHFMDRKGEVTQNLITRPKGASNLDSRVRGGASNNPSGMEQQAPPPQANTTEQQNPFQNE
ncbi:uncharacterized protein LOC134856853 [Symsagittifera roscoffensis]|uniref:uncharacterized protein LOC134856853 n=1 Tax=Symsagittifera roscoffensis TaxID=84072 RepID=UPI00307BA754